MRKATNVTLLSALLILSCFAGLSGCTFQSDLDGARCDEPGAARGNQKCVGGWWRLVDAAAPSGRDASHTSDSTEPDIGSETRRSSPSDSSGSDTFGSDTSGPDTYGDTGRGGDDGECIRSCGGRECGPDGCGGWCGSCGEDEKCVGGSCECPEPSCGDRECGSVANACGGSKDCGDCGEDASCEGGSCVCDDPCSGRECGSATNACTSGSRNCGDCSQFGSKFTCDDGQCECEPNCAGDYCGGPDGCGGTCGPPPGDDCCPGEKTSCPDSSKQVPCNNGAWKFGECN